MSFLGVLPSILSAAEKPEGYFSRLAELGNSIQEISATKFVTIEDKRFDGRVTQMHLDTAFQYSRPTGKLTTRVLRADGLTDPVKDKGKARHASGVPKVGDEWTAGQVIPEPEWLWALDRNTNRWRQRSVKEKDGVLLEMRQPGRETGGPAKTILLTRDGLPVRVRTYGVKGKVLDEIGIGWGMSNGAPFPSTITITQYSRLNTLVTTIRYEGVRIGRSEAKREVYPK